MANHDLTLHSGQSCGGSWLRERRSALTGFDSSVGESSAELLREVLVH
jgi:hypothetical protein